MTATARRAWAQRVLLQVDAVGPTLAETTFEIHAGASYRNFGLTAGLRAKGAAVEIVAEHLGQGEQLAFYSNSRSERTHHSGRPRTVQPRSKQAVDRANKAYSALGEYLVDNSGHALTLSFIELEDVLGRPLPTSARRHRAWWANDSSGTHSHARAWMDAGWVLDQVDMRTELVRLRRTSR